MSVYTTADEKKDSAVSHVREAVKDLSEICVNEAWGSDEFCEEYRELLWQSMVALKEIYEKIK